MAEEKDDREQKIEILKAMNKAIAEGPWEKTAFLKATGKKLREIRDRFKADFNLTHIEDETTSSEKVASPVTERVAERPDQTEVYISLYNTDGGNLRKWEKLLSTLGAYTLSRPVYRRESDARTMVRSKLQKRNEAYVAVYVDNKDILQVPEEKIPKDRLGHELLLLKDKALRIENITRFMHATGVYAFKESKLVREDDVKHMDFI